MLRPFNNQRRRLTGCRHALGLSSAALVDDGRADKVAPFGPGAVVVADLAEAEQILEDEPGVRAALADAAVGDDFVFAGNALGFVEFFQFVEGLESAVFIGSLYPRDIGGLGNMAGALGGFGHARRGDDLSGELIDGANVNELAGFAAIKNGEDLFLVSAQGFVSARDVIGGWSDLCRFGRKLAVLFEPLFAA